ncbi:MAG: 3-oxoacyl-[acyl-carrier-protein] synthase, KASIII [Parcubacteria group bacterium GW2011_GWC2_45_7]|nr:MAG: 3-oxoacyl-[acyl-carrier-protein] synthase, KASIII [Parcubacteria group bacterium GW2011_GWC2_45_7]KKU73057.1 MAG: 3-oxoacyl-[acyl-carrier-protein] synthase, KASIII [Parcubacteria group bacterium GW2011_GWA2_47_26]
MNGAVRGQIIGTGSFLPPEIVNNDTLFHELGINKPGSWLQEKCGIKRRRLNFDFSTGRKPERAFSDTDLAEQAARRALEDANLEGGAIDHLVHISCTPDKLHFMYSAIELHRRLGLGCHARVEHIDSGCAGIAKGIEMACTYLQAASQPTRRALIVASNTPSPFFVDWRRYVEKKHWLSAVVFADGAGAMVLQATAELNTGIQECFYEVDGTHPLVDYPAGGVLNPTTADNVAEHLYMMDARDVAVQFQPAMSHNVERLGLGSPEKRARLDRVYIHQANRWFVEGFAHHAGIPLDRIPVNIVDYGNTSAASTLILLDEDRRAGRVKGGDSLCFLWVGAGMMMGGALVRL